LADLIVATAFWDQNEHTYPNSRGFSEAWVDRLYRGFARNLTAPFRFLCFTERERQFVEPVEQWQIEMDRPHCGALVEPYRLNRPMITCGLDTVIVGNIDHMARWCLDGDRIALPKHPYEPVACTGIALVPAGFRSVWETYDGNPDDMVHLRKQPHVFTDDLWPGQVLSYKAHVRGRPFPPAARVVYMHGAPKMGELAHEPFVQEHWC
jgi:hypothetical protein